MLKMAGVVCEWACHEALPPPLALLQGRLMWAAQLYGVVSGMM